jgi:prolipoprotein diacylglyceryltransferase
VVAFGVYLALRRRFADSLATPLRWAVVAAAVAGGAVGAKLLFWLEDPRLTGQSLNNPAYLAGGKTIVGGLVFGLIAVELMKRYIGLRQSTGDLYAIPLALGIAIGRVGCFLTGLSDNTYGIPTNLPWAVNFGDNIPRHPTQLYEIAFLLALTPTLYYVLKRIIAHGALTRCIIPSEASPLRSESDAQSKDPAPAAMATVASGNSPRALTLSTSTPTTDDQRRTTSFRPGDAFKFFMVSYLAFRLLIDFIKPYPRLFLGLGGIQWACALTLLYYSPDIVRWLHNDSRVSS